LESKEEEKLDIESIDNITKEITSNIKKHSSILFYIGHKGEVIMMSTGDMSKVQKSVATRMLVVAGDHSFILKIVFLKPIVSVIILNIYCFIRSKFLVGV